MPHQYKRRTFDEAMEIAREAFRNEMVNNLSGDEIEEVRRVSTVCGGSVRDGWSEVIGHSPDDRLHYEIQIYKASEKCPYIEKYYARILVTRDRESDGVWIMWKPEVEPYDGPEFT